MSGGELPALLLIDAMVRQLPGVLNDAQSNVEESFVDGLLDCPHYTRPEHAGRRRGAGGAAVGEPRRDRALAAQAVAGAHLAAATGSAGGRKA